MSILVDTSCLLRLPNSADPRHDSTQAAFGNLTAQGETLVVAKQNCIEFRNAVSRPTAVNGLGLTPQQADAELDFIEGIFARLPEQEEVYDVWRALCRRAGVSGKQVHDTRLVAVCVAAGVETILTWNPRDFARFISFVPGLIVLTPEDVLAAP